MYQLLISVQELQALQASGRPLMVFDCTGDLMNPPLGHQQYLQAHLPGALFADLNEHLSDKHGSDVASGGRHPLPSPERFAQWLGSVGLTHDHQVVVMDRNGANYCGRLWWMLKWVGHADVAVLDGGLQAWQAAAGPVESGPVTPSASPTRYAPRPALRTLATTQDVLAALDTATVIDARAAARYRGEVEPLDPVAGHIPGALNRPFQGNMGAEGRFKPAAELRAEFTTLLAGRDPAAVIHHCGSGVSAVPNLLAMEIAGFGPTALYAGSWSEWCADPSRPVARG